MSEREKSVSNYETTLKLNKRGMHVPRPCGWLVLIIVLERSKVDKRVGERNVEWMAVKAGTSSIRSQSPCAGGRGVGR
jgi:hypothetical protein